MAIDVNLIFTIVVDFLKKYIPRFGFAIVVLVVGWIAIRIFMNIFEKVLEKRKVDQSLNHFLVSLTGIILKVLLLLSFVATVGIETSSFVAALAALGFAIGLALQGSLSNFAGGVLILFFKPFKVGDFIEFQGVFGKVRKIDIINTVLNTPDNKRIIIPNGPLANDIIINFTAEKTRRVDMVFSISYGDDVKKARGIIEKAIKQDNRILQDPAHQIVLGLLNASSVDITTRVWVNRDDYWPVFFDMQEKVKGMFDENGITIPFPQQDVHIFNHQK